jgi:zinc transporter ZupT
MVLREFPEDRHLLLLGRRGFNRKASTLYSLLAAAVSTPLGTLMSFHLIERIERWALGALLALSAGALVYVGASHLLPAVEREYRRYSLIALLSGIMVAGVIVLSES